MSMLMGICCSRTRENQSASAYYDDSAMYTYIIASGGILCG